MWLAPKRLREPRRVGQQQQLKRGAAGIRPRRGPKGEEARNQSALAQGGPTECLGKTDVNIERMRPKERSQRPQGSAVGLSPRDLGSEIDQRRGPQGRAQVRRNPQGLGGEAACLVIEQASAGLGNAFIGERDHQRRSTLRSRDDTRGNPHPSGAPALQGGEIVVEGLGEAAGRRDDQLDAAVKNSR